MEDFKFDGKGIVITKYGKNIGVEKEEELSEKDIESMADTASEFMEERTGVLEKMIIGEKLRKTENLAKAHEELKQSYEETKEWREEEDLTNPNHYKVNNIESIDLMEIRYGSRAVLAFCLLNYDKYTYRAGHKGSYTLDQDKAKWYLDRYREIYNKISVGEEIDGLSNLLQ